MKKIKNTLWNRIFCSKALKEYQEWKEKANSIIGWNKQLNEDLKRASSLQELINVHKHAWVWLEIDLVLIQMKKFTIL